jgi:hypothetical protein
MKYVVTSWHTEDWKDLADLTDANKEEYCKRHNYGFIVKKEPPWNVSHDTNKGNDRAWERPYAILAAMKKWPECEWVLFSDCDAVITNMTITLDRIVDNRFHIVVAADVNGINCGNILVRNSEIGKSFCEAMIASLPAYRDHPMMENQWIQEMTTGTYWRKWAKIAPQRIFNSYDYSTLPQYTPPVNDALGVPGDWQTGDFIIHVVDQKNWKNRIPIVKKYLEKVVV